MLCLISIAEGTAQRLVPGPGAEAPDPGYVRLITQSSLRRPRRAAPTNAIAANSAGKPGTTLLHPRLVSSSGS